MKSIITRFLIFALLILISSHVRAQQQLKILYYTSDTVFNTGETVDISFMMEYFDYESIIIDSMALVNSNSNVHDTLYLDNITHFDTTYFNFKGFLNDTVSDGKFNIVLIDKNKNYYPTNGIIYIGSIYTEEPEVCMVTVDAETNKNMIIFKMPKNYIPDSAFIYKEISNNNFQKIGSSDVGKGVNFLIDHTSNPAQNAGKYKITFGDSLGNFTRLSWNAHKTIHLLMNFGVGGTINLMWEPYEGFYYTAYNIYRGSSIDDLVLIATLPGSNQTYTDLTPPSGDLYYVVSITNPDGCNLNTNLKSTESLIFSTQSNVVNKITSSSLEKLDNIELSLMPNPVNEKLFIQINSNDKVIDIQIVSLEGKVQFQERIRNDSEIDVSAIKSGYYFVIINIEGNKITRQLIIN